MQHVLVAGTEIVRDGAYTGATPGIVLRAGRDTDTVHPDHGGLMNAPNVRATPRLGRRRRLTATRRARGSVLARLRRRSARGVPPGATPSARCARTEGMFGGHGVHGVALRGRAVGAEAPEVFSSKDVVNIGNDVPLMPLSVDPPEHAKYRRLLDPQFSPKRMAELEPEARTLVNEIIDVFVGRGECDFHDEFATPLPSTIFLALMGLPQADLPDFLKWRDDTIRPAGDTLEEDEAQRDGRGPGDRARTSRRPSRRSAATPTTGC